MRITSFEFWPILVPDFPLLNVSGLHAPFVPRIVWRCILDDTHVGWAETPCNSGMLKLAPQLMVWLRGKKVIPIQTNELLGEVVREIRERANRYELTDQRGNASFDSGVSNHLRAGIQMALFDAIAVNAGVPLCDFLGGGHRKRSRVEFNLYLFFQASTEGSGLYYNVEEPQRAYGNEFYRFRDKPVLSLEEARRIAQWGVEVLMPGVKLLKWKLGVFSPDEELEIITSVAEALHPSIQIVPDPNATWDLDTTIRIVSEFKRRLGDRLAYFEDPVAGQLQMAEVHRCTGVPLATNMCASNLLEHQIARDRDAIQITLGGDCHYIGGSDEAVRLSQWCAAQRMGFGNHSNSHLGISHAHTCHMLAAAESPRPADSHYIPYHMDRDPLVHHPIEVRPGGICEIPERPGIGVDIRESGLRELNELFVAANSRGRKFENRNDSLAAAQVYGGWTPPDQRPERKWFMAGVSKK